MSLKKLWRATLSVIPIVVIAALLFPECAARSQQFIRPTAPVTALVHARVIDGNGGPAADDQTVIIDHSRIVAVGRAGAVRVPAGASTLDVRGRTIIPGLVGMHDHLFYQIEAGSTSFVIAPRTFARLYLASGVTTIRTAGAADFNVDAHIKRAIDKGEEPGPKIHLTGPYLVASGSEPDPDAIAKQVAAYADKGATSFKAYTTLRRSELKAAIAAAHERGLTVTGHLCAVGYDDAIKFGIDNIEHGIVFDSDFVRGKVADQCPNQWDVFGSVIRMHPGDVDMRRAIDQLARHAVAVTSTLAVLESYAIDESEIDPRVPILLSSSYQSTFQQARERRRDRKRAGQSWWAAVLRSEMAFERAFVSAGGKLLAGADPTGWGGVVGGFADQRGLELLVAAGFTPEQAIEIASSNGARFLGDRTIGVIAEGRQADLVVVRGDPSRNISDVRNVELVFKDGVAYDPDALIAAAAGTLGKFAIERLFNWPVAIVLAFMVIRRTVRIVRRRKPVATLHTEPALQPQ